VILIVKSAFLPSHIRVIAILAVLISALSGCGQKGPLYLPAKPAPVPASTPAPAPADDAKPAAK
jgi:predicted small lipoprotein YifL